jgi:hypothetical protein
MIQTLYNMFYNDVFGASVPSEAFMIHEVSLVLTYVVLGLFLALIYKIVVSTFSRFLK